MTVTVSWGYDTTQTITSFTLEKSTDKGVSFSSLVSIAFNPAGANFDAANNRFFYNDAAGAVGHVYKIYAVGPLGTSEARIAISAPAETSKCTIIGYVEDAFGEVDTSIQVLVEAFGGREDRWVQSPTGVVAQNSRAVGITSGRNIVYPNSDGIWQVRLTRKTVARITINELGLDWAFEVPDKDGPVNIRDIPQIRGGSFYGIYPEQDGTQS